MKNAYLAIKYHEDHSNKKMIEEISTQLRKIGIEPIVAARDFEKYGEVKFTAQKLMNISFESIDASDMVIVELSEKGVGIGIEAGYARASGKPIIVIAKEGSDISETLKGITEKIIFYNDVEELSEKFKE